MTTTNYLSPENFEILVKVLPLVTDYNTIKKTNPDGIPDPEDLKILARIEYLCALRVSEVLSLTPEDFDFENRILTLNHTKTGYKKCTKCKGKGMLGEPDDIGDGTVNGNTSACPEIIALQKEAGNDDYLGDIVEMEVE